MKQIHKREKEQFRTLFQQEKVDRINDRFTILDVFLQTENHLTIEELEQILKEAGHDYDSHFVRDTMKLICRFGFASKLTFDDGLVRYEHRHLGQHHDHMICTKCGKILEFEDDHLEEVQARIASARGFHMLQHKMEIYGICDRCMKSHVKWMPLTMAKPGEHLVIRDFTGGANARMRLMTMGLRQGDHIEIITNSGTGQLVVALDYNRYVIGRGMAQKVLVEPLKKEARKGKTI
ncbi:MAG: transcriptional repressor [Desulfobacterales bacterium]